MKTRHLVVLIAVTALCAERASAGCPYFTRPSMESEDGVTRTNYYEYGSWVCYRNVMHLCQSSGTWKTIGDCTSYRNWEEMSACRLEGAPAEQCAPGGPSNPTGSGGGSGSASGGIAMPKIDMPKIEMPPIEMPKIEFPDPFGGGSGSSPGGWNGGGSPSPSYPPAVPAPEETSPFGGATAPLAGAPNGDSSACAAAERNLARMVQGLPQNAGICEMARHSRPLAEELETFYASCPNADPGGEWRRYAQQLRQWSQQAAQSACNGGR